MFEPPQSQTIVSCRAILRRMRDEGPLAMPRVPDVDLGRLIPKPSQQRHDIGAALHVRQHLPREGRDREHTGISRASALGSLYYGDPAVDPIEARTIA